MALFDMMQNTQQVGMMQGQGSQVPVNPIARAIRSYTQATMFRQALAEEQQKKAQAEQEFAMQQKLREEQLKESQQAQKIREQQAAQEKARFDWEQEVKTTPIGKYLDMAGLRGKMPWITPEMEQMTVGQVAGFETFVMNNLSEQMNPQFRYEATMKTYDALNAGWSKEAVMSIAKETPWIDKEDLDAAITARDMSPENMLKTLKIANETRELMLNDLTQWAGEYNKYNTLAEKEKDATKKKEYQTKADVALEKLNYIPEAITSRYADDPNFSVLNDMVTDMYDSDLILQYPELIGIMMARPQIAAQNYARAQSGGVGGRYRRRGGGAPSSIPGLTAAEASKYSSVGGSYTVDGKVYGAIAPKGEGDLLTQYADEKARVQAYYKSKNIKWVESNWISYKDYVAIKTGKQLVPGASGGDGNIGTPPPPNPFEPPK